MLRLLRVDKFSAGNVESFDSIQLCVLGPSADGSATYRYRDAAQTEILVRAPNLRALGQLGVLLKYCPENETNFSPSALLA